MREARRRALVTAPCADGSDAQSQTIRAIADWTSDLSSHKNTLLCAGQATIEFPLNKFMSETIARAHFAPHEQSFWQWSEDGVELALANGRLVAFRQQVVGILERLEHDGLPPFPALVMLMVSFSNDWSRDEVRHGIFSPFLNGICTIYPEEWDDAKELVHETMEVLEKINEQPFSQSPTGQATVAELVLPRREVSSEDAPGVVGALRDLSTSLAPRPPQSPEDSLADTLRQIKLLHEGLRKLDFNVVAVRAATGLDDIPSTPEELEVGREFSYLLQQLREDDELGALVNLANRLVPASHLPRLCHSPVDVTGDGYGDISNRGELHRLLLTELAYDELTMAARLANNEALYLRREPAQQSLDRHRILLLDCGIRMWGVPRIMATAAALAFASTTGNGTVQIWRSDEDRVKAVSLSSRADLIDHLEVLETTAHPGLALVQLLRLLPPRDREVIFITHERALQDPDFRRHLRLVNSAHLYAATVNSHGEFCIYSVTSSGNLRLRHAEMERSILRDACAPTKATSTGERPLIYDLDEFPLRVPADVDVRHVCANGPDQAIALQPDGTLLYFDDPKRCPRLLSVRLPEATPSAAFFQEGECILLARAGESRARIAVQADLIGRVVSSPVQLQVSRGLPAYVDGGIVFYVSLPEVHAVDLATGEILQTVDCREHKLRHHDGRFCKSSDKKDNGWYQFSWSNGIQFDRMGDAQEIVHPFDRFGHLGPWSVGTDGEIIDRSIDRSILTNMLVVKPVTWAQSSPDGHLVIACDNANQLWQYDLQSSSVERLTLRPDQTEEWQAVLESHNTAATATTRPGVRGITAALVQSGNLFLQYEEQGWLGLTFDHGVLCLLPGDPLVVNRATFMAIPSPRGFGVTLRRAELPRGACILDSLNMLHIRANDSASEEICITLTDGPLAAWTSANRVFGLKELTHGEEQDCAEFEPMLRSVLAACE